MNATKSIGDFHASEFQITPLRAVRAFRVTEMGHLKSIHYAHMWKVGENTATCDWDEIYKHRRLVADVETYEHDMGEHTCGFYSFLDGSKDYYTPGRVEGVVEAYGHVYLYSRGLRSSKARIVALCVPRENGVMARLTRWHHRHPNGTWFTLAALVFGAILFATGLVVAAAKESFWPLGVGFGLIMLAWPNVVATGRAFDLEDAETPDPVLISRAYPGIPVYRSRAAMLAAFPTDTPPEKAVA